MCRRMMQFGVLSFWWVNLRDHLPGNIGRDRLNKMNNKIIVLFCIRNFYLFTINFSLFPYLAPLNYFYGWKEIFYAFKRHKVIPHFWKRKLSVDAWWHCDHGNRAAVDGGWQKRWSQPVSSWTSLQHNPYNHRSDPDHCRPGSRMFCDLQKTKDQRIIAIT